MTQSPQHEFHKNMEGIKRGKKKTYGLIIKRKSGINHEKYAEKTPSKEKTCFSVS